MGSKTKKIGSDNTFTVACDCVQIKLILSCLSYVSCFSMLLQPYYLAVTCKTHRNAELGHERDAHIHFGHHACVCNHLVDPIGNSETLRRLQRHSPSVNLRIPLTESVSRVFFLDTMAAEYSRAWVGKRNILGTIGFSLTSPGMCQKTAQKNVVD